MKCPRCKDTVYSRALHDFRSCSCGGVSVDGGFDYMKGCCSTDLPGPVETVKVVVEATRDELFRDWNTQANKFGLIKGQ